MEKLRPPGFIISPVARAPPSGSKLRAQGGCAGTVATRSGRLLPSDVPLAQAPSASRLSLHRRGRSSGHADGGPLPPPCAGPTIRA
jgi:hypothetical protein